VERIAEKIIRVAEIPQGRLREENKFRCIYCSFSHPLSHDKIFNIDKKQRKRRAIGTVYAFLHTFRRISSAYIYIYIYIYVDLFVKKKNVTVYRI